jgi:hypothetical protein
MPLLDHFHPPLSDDRPWSGFHAAWVSGMADDLNRRLPADYFAGAQPHAGASVEIDVATFQKSKVAARVHRGSRGTATLAPRVWTPPAPELTVPAVFADDFEVRVISTQSGPTLVAAIELVSPRNNDRPSARRAFAAKCAGYLYQSVSLIVIDVVTARQANLHASIMRLLGRKPAPHVSEVPPLYAVAYRPIRRKGEDQIDVWPVGFDIGETLPTLPLALNAEQAVPVDLEATYMDARRRRRLA